MTAAVLLVVVLAPAVLFVAGDALAGRLHWAADAVAHRAQRARRRHTAMSHDEIVDPLRRTR